MLKWSLIFLVIAIIAGIFGFTNVESGASTIAMILFGTFMFLFLGALILGFTIFKKVTS